MNIGLTHGVNVRIVGLQIISCCRAEFSYLLCSDSKAQLDHEGNAVDDWVQYEHPLLKAVVLLDEHEKDIGSEQMAELAGDAGKMRELQDYRCSALVDLTALEKNFENVLMFLSSCLLWF
ncbi:hypothetical protein C1H46_003790 [Malus baccata]|uniref:Uncharacterized protein n=1 Tax=Malus baccata TaxID=106549 RepID=A0A540NHN0_MALBA|nr:hypothetical protein C1H46_003790 [Malus baccata]